MHRRRSRPRRGAMIALAVASCTLVTACDDSSADSRLDAASTSAAPATATPAPSRPAFPADADWKALSYPAAQCMTREQYAVGGLSPAGWDEATVDATPGDVTGDGVDEMLIQLTCPMPSSGHQEQVVVFTPAAEGPQVIGVLRDDVFFSDATVTTGDRSVTLAGWTWADDATCCPGHWATLTYRWTGDGLSLVSKMEARTTQAFESGGLEDGNHVGVLTGIGDGQILVDVVQWFDGDAAKQACAEDGFTPSETPSCRDYYYRNDNDLMRVLAVADDASITYLDWATGMTPRSATDLSAVAVSNEGIDYYLGAAFFKFTVDDGQVTRMEEFFVS